MRFIVALRASGTLRRRCAAPRAAPASLATLVLLLTAPTLTAQDASRGEIAEPFKVGTFEIDGAARVGLVLRDALIVDIGAANRALERDPRPAPPPPARGGVSKEAAPRGGGRGEGGG
ncbi:MAG: hypothetical protein F4X00_15965, partial [Gemmatimonadetes bacterium]|nr:hypothetical protein [Gemmatimonadota bacterium]